MPGYCSHTASGYGASAGSPNHARRYGTPATPSTPWAAQPGATKPAESSGHPGSPAVRDLAASDQLTAQELQIAQLAAQGLSNRDIAQRLYLSHRTIGTHLYRIFPKLGIISRGELRSALSSSTALGKR